MYYYNYNNIFHDFIMGNCLRIFQDYQKKRRDEKKLKELLEKSRRSKDFYFKKYNLKKKNYINLAEGSYS